MVSGTAVTPALISDAVTLTSMSTTGTSPPTSNMNMTPLYSRVRRRCAAPHVCWSERHNISVCSNYRRMMKSRKTRSIQAGNATNRPVFAAMSTLEQQRWCTSQTCRVSMLLRTSSSSAKKVSSSCERGAEEGVLFALQRMSSLGVAVAVVWLAYHAAAMPNPIAWYSFEDSFVDSEVCLWLVDITATTNGTTTTQTLKTR